MKRRNTNMNVLNIIIGAESQIKDVLKMTASASGSLIVWESVKFMAFYSKSFKYGLKIVAKCVNKFLNEQIIDTSLNEIALAQKIIFMIEKNLEKLKKQERQYKGFYKELNQIIYKLNKINGLSVSIDNDLSLIENILMAIKAHVGDYATKN
jgi:hypothetical protein